jgi:AcrR family transcriptional regulator
MSVAARREREREGRRSLILDAAERVFQRRGLDATTMDDIAAEAQLAKGTLYLYFATKEELLLGMALRHQATVLADFDQAQRNAATGLELVRQLLHGYARGMLRSREHLRMVMSRWVNGVPLDSTSSCAGELRDNIQRIFERYCHAIATGQRDGSIRPSLDPPRTATILWSALNGRLLLELQSRGTPAQHPPLPSERGGNSLPSVDDHIDLLLDALSGGYRDLPKVAEP